MNGQFCNVSIKNLINKCTELAAFLRKSKDRRKTLENACKETNVKYCLVVKPNSTRWNSQHDCLQSVIRLKPALQFIWNHDLNGEWSDVLLLPVDYQIAESIVNILKQFKIATKKLEGDKVVTSTEVLPQLFDLKEMLQQTQDSTVLYVRQFGMSLLNSLERRFPQGGTTNSLVCIAHYLDPRWHGLVLDEYPGSLNRTKESIREMLSSETVAIRVIDEDELHLDVNENVDDVPAIGMARLKKKRNASGLNSSVVQQTSLDREFDSWDNRQRNENVNDILQHWNTELKSMYPLLAQVAPQVFSLQPSSAASERTFNQWKGIF